MPRDGAETRERILDATHELVLEQGFAATTIDQVIQGAGITKGAFYYHFDSKAELGESLIRRYAEVEERLMGETMARAERLAGDPVQQLLVFVGLIEEQLRELDQPHPGCLFASFSYDRELENTGTRAVISEAILGSRRLVGGKIREAMESRPPKRDVDVETLADMFLGIFEGAFILARTLDDTSALASQIGQYRNYLELLFDA